MLQDLKLRFCSAALSASVNSSADSWAFGAAIPAALAIVREIADAVRRGRSSTNARSGHALLRTRVVSVQEVRHEPVNAN
jgi:hypothetical protein